jgi:hypothetical protein
MSRPGVRYSKGGSLTMMNTSAKNSVPEIANETTVLSANSDKDGSVPQERKQNAWHPIPTAFNTGDTWSFPPEYARPKARPTN